MKKILIEAGVISEMVRLYDLGTSINQLHKMFGPSNKKIKEILISEGVVLRTMSEISNSVRTKELVKATNRLKFGVDYPLQLKVNRDKQRATKEERYGDPNYCNPVKIRKTKEERYGDPNYCNIEQAKKTNMFRYGVENPFQNTELVRVSVFNKYGVDSVMQVEHIRKRQQNILMERHGTNNPSFIEGIEEKKKQTCLVNFGVEYPLQSEIVKAKSRKTKEERYGDPNYQNTIKAQETNMIRYGCSSPLQNTIIFDKFMNTSYNHKIYKFPSGREESIQGYEPFMLDHLLKSGIDENDIVVGVLNVPRIEWNDCGISRYHFPDVWLPKLNKILEVKSEYTFRKTEEILSKKKAAECLGFVYQVFIFDRKGEIINVIV